MTETLKRIRAVTDKLKENKHFSMTKFLARSNTESKAYSAIFTRNNEDPYILDGLVRGSRWYVDTLQGVAEEGITTYSDDIMNSMNSRIIKPVIAQMDMDVFYELLDLFNDAWTELNDIQHTLLPLPKAHSLEIPEGELDAVNPLFDTTTQDKIPTQKRDKIDIEQEELKKRIKSFMNSSVEEVIERNNM